jgi:hypothetical protein
MPDRYRIQLYWPPRNETLEVTARALHAFLISLAPIHPTLAGFRYDDGEREVPVGSAEDCARALRQGQVAWSFGETEKPAFELTLFVVRAYSPPVSLTLTAGIEPGDLDGVFAPNRLEMWVAREAPDELASPPVLQALLARGAEQFGAEFGYVGSATVPTPASPLVSPGLPPVGWMTFLSNSRPPLPVLPTPAVAYAAGSVGSIVVAHPKAYREHLREQREAVAAVERALSAAGVLAGVLDGGQPLPAPG